VVIEGAGTVVCSGTCGDVLLHPEQKSMIKSTPVVATVKKKFM
jgi:hypothetical protein